MRRTTLTEKQKAVALLVASGQHEYKAIAQMVGCHFNSVTNWLRDERVQALVTTFQENIQDKLENMALESTHRKNSPLLIKAAEQLEKLLESKSPQRQMEAIKFLLNGSITHHEKQDGPQGEQLSPLRLDPELRSRLRVTRS